MNPSDYARSKGVVGLIYVPDFQYLANWQRNRQRIMERGSSCRREVSTRRPAPPLPSIVIHPKLANCAVRRRDVRAAGIFNAPQSRRHCPRRLC